jgi:hypothetical protein
MTFFYLESQFDIYDIKNDNIVQKIIEYIYDCFNFEFNFKNIYKTCYKCKNCNNYIMNKKLCKLCFENKFKALLIKKTLNNITKKLPQEIIVLINEYISEV